MKKNRIFIILALLFCVKMIFAQAMVLEKKVTIQYFDVRLEEALDDISESYDVNFSYSINMISVDQRVSADVHEESLAFALNDLLDDTDITYIRVGNHIVLKVDEEKRRLLSQRKEKVIPVLPEPPAIWTKEILETPELITSKDCAPLPVEFAELIVNLKPVYHPIKKVEVLFPPIIEKHYDPQLKLAQVSLVTGLGTNKGRSSSTTNRVSANILWGKNGGVNGAEVGGLVNTIVNDVEGVQIAGLGNSVGNDVTGTQIGGVFNLNRGKTRGVQVGGVLNVSRDVNAVQAAGVLNVATESFDGLQAAGLGNVSGADSEGGLQIGGLFNINTGNARGQVSSLLNIGRKVEGFQIGLINIADTVSGPAIGLISLVRKGYNRVEISGADLLHTNLELKLGSHQFYNIFHGGYRPEKNKEVWGVGYGAGTQLKTKKDRWTHNLELLATQIIPKTNWDKKMNLLSQFRWSVDFRVGKRTSLFAGPTFNVKVKESDEPFDIAGYTSLASKTFFETTLSNLNDPTNPKYHLVEMWAGFNAGIRF